jgi:hypothetical protein
MIEWFNEQHTGILKNEPAGKSIQLLGHICGGGSLRQFRAPLSGGNAARFIGAEARTLILTIHPSSIDIA